MQNGDRNDTHPKVFISHASEDKERFVEKFATELRKKGVDAWYDKWEIKIGNNLVDKIFDEGIKKSDIVIIVISKYSIDKPWVKEELNVSVVKKIEGEIKLMPIIIDECSIPECLKATAWKKISMLNNYTAELNEIIHSIYDKDSKPPLGEAPEYVKTVIDNMANLTEIDSLVMKVASERAIELGHPRVSTEFIVKNLAAHEISPEIIYESLEILDRNGYIKAMKNICSSHIEDFHISLFGFDEYLRVFLKNYNDIINNICFHIVNNANCSNTTIAEALNCPIRIVDHVLDVLENQNFIGLLKSIGGRTGIYNISAELKRRMRKLS